MNIILLSNLKSNQIELTERNVVFDIERSVDKR